MSAPRSPERLPVLWTILALVVGLLILLLFWLFYIGVAGNMGFSRWSGGLPFIVLTAIEVGAMAVVLAQSFYKRVGARRIAGRMAIATWALSCIDIFLLFAVMKFY
jgi:hypothetical protein